MNVHIIVFKEIRIIEIREKKIRIVECASPTDISNYRGDRNTCIFF
jgi:hypothetical protein